MSFQAALDSKREWSKIQENDDDDEEIVVDFMQHRSIQINFSNSSHVVTPNSRKKKLSTWESIKSCFGCLKSTSTSLTAENQKIMENELQGYQMSQQGMSVY